MTAADGPLITPADLAAICPGRPVPADGTLLISGA
jgi:hypothetical protein